jgi:hypothetical protein
MDTRPVLRWVMEETPATATAPRQVYVRAVWDRLPVAWTGEVADWPELDRKPAVRESAPA